MKNAPEALVILVEMFLEMKASYEKTKSLTPSSTQYILQDGIIKGLDKAIEATYRLKGFMEEEALKENKQ